MDYFSLILDGILLGITSVSFVNFLRSRRSLKESRRILENAHENMEESKKVLDDIVDAKNRMLTYCERCGSLINLKK